MVLDPGLREQGGHHPAFILSMLSTDCFAQNNPPLRVFSNKAFEPSDVFNDVSNTVEFTPFFDTDFYRYFYETIHHPELPNFIRSLTSEYLQAMLQLYAEDVQTKNTKADSTTIICHALGWEHASALADAMFLFKKQVGINFRLVVVLMFSPYRESKESSYDAALYLRYKVAFKRLALWGTVSFFACDYETSKAYEYILNQSIEIMPCPFVSATKATVNSASKQNQVLLYMGDTKATKGFLDLPKLLEMIIEEGGQKDTIYIIQYTLTNTSKEFLAVDKQLKALAQSYSYINIYSGFCSEQQLHEMLSASKAIVFNYDNSVYKYQSSGVLWLAAFYDLHMYFLTDNWLARESERLDCTYTVCNAESLPKSLNELGQVDVNQQLGCANINPESPSAYHAKLFGKFAEWLDNLQV